MCLVGDVEAEFSGTMKWWYDYLGGDAIGLTWERSKCRATMGLLSIIRKIKRKEKEMRILMVGLDNSGKTTIVMKINGGGHKCHQSDSWLQYQNHHLPEIYPEYMGCWGPKNHKIVLRNYFEQN
ncbi:hypothetical protein SLE2022_303430 [Rubroshorea leprosula]